MQFCILFGVVNLVLVKESVKILACVLSIASKSFLHECTALCIKHKYTKKDMLWLWKNNKSKCHDAFIAIKWLLLVSISCKKALYDICKTCHNINVIAISALLKYFQIACKNEHILIP